MGILTRYLIRSHAGPFLFALSILTALLYLNSVAQKLDELVGKSLPWDLVLEFLVLTLPHTLALSIPMAVLVSVLYAFADLGANSEIMAMAASGVKPTRLTIPVLFFGALFTFVMLVFNDRILPEANHRLKNLSVTITQKRPTFLLEEGIINQIEDGENNLFFLYAQRIDPVTSKMEDVEIRTLDSGGFRTIYADRGHMAWNSARTDIFMTLEDGEIHETSPRDPDGFERTDFQVEIIPLRGINNQLQQQNIGSRTDREMGFAMLLATADSFRVQLDSVRAVAAETTRTSLLIDLGYPDPGLEGLDPDLREGGGSSRVEDELPIQVNLAEGFEREMNSHLVEYHKKLAIAIACLAFVLIGVPLSMRFPRGGVGMVIVVSIVIFAVYWAGLIAGEEIGNRGIVPPWVAMWAANAVFLAIGIVLFFRIGRGESSRRGGGIGESISGLLRSRRRAASAPEVEATSG